MDIIDKILSNQTSSNMLETVEKDGRLTKKAIDTNLYFKLSSGGREYQIDKEYIKSKSKIAISIADNKINKVLVNNAITVKEEYIQGIDESIGGIQIVCEFTSEKLKSIMILAKIDEIATHPKIPVTIPGIVGIRCINLTGKDIKIGNKTVVKNKETFDVTLSDIDRFSAIMELMQTSLKLARLVSSERKLVSITCKKSSNMFIKMDVSKMKPILIDFNDDTIENIRYTLLAKIEGSFTNKDGGYVICKEGEESKTTSITKNEAIKLARQDKIAHCYVTTEGKLVGKDGFRLTELCTVVCESKNRYAASLKNKKIGERIISFEDCIKMNYSVLIQVSDKGVSVPFKEYAKYKDILRQSLLSGASYVILNRGNLITGNKMHHLKLDLKDVEEYLR